jgi:hypothetical protein
VSTFSKTSTQTLSTSLMFGLSAVTTVGDSRATGMSTEISLPSHRERVKAERKRQPFDSRGGGCFMESAALLQ